uniref:VWFD domain-containing protein n=1 Tax=Panagrellus redivivus TaxID=6233 RepID=A0A7E4VIQ1_PANRE
MWNFSDLKKRHIERVLFSGDELVIFVDNSAGNEGDLQICFGSSPDESCLSCPSGFTGATIQIQENGKVLLTITRRRHFPDSILRTLEDKDSTLNITITESHDTRCVTLKNAAVFKSEEPKKVNKKSKGTTIGIVVGVVGLIHLVIGICVTVGICLDRQNKNKKPTTPPEIVVEVPKVTETLAQSPAIDDLKEKPSTPKAAPGPKTKSPQTSVQPSPTPNDVPASEKKPMPPPGGETPALPEHVGHQPTPPSTELVGQPPKKAKSKWKAGTPKATPPTESTEPTKEASVDQPERRNSKRDSKKSLKVEKTLPSPPTPKFSNHPFLKAVTIFGVDQMLRNGKRQIHPTRQLHPALVDRIETELGVFGYRPEYGLIHRVFLQTACICTKIPINTYDYIVVPFTSNETTKDALTLCMFHDDVTDYADVFTSPVSLLSSWMMAQYISDAKDPAHRVPKDCNTRLEGASWTQLNGGFAYKCCYEASNNASHIETECHYSTVLDAVNGLDNDDADAVDENTIVSKIASDTLVHFPQILAKLFGAEENNIASCIGRAEQLDDVTNPCCCSSQEVRNNVAKCIVNSKMAGTSYKLSCAVALSF